MKKLLIILLFVTIDAICASDERISFLASSSPAAYTTFGIAPDTSKLLEKINEFSNLGYVPNHLNTHEKAIFYAQWVAEKEGKKPYEELLKVSARARSEDWPRSERQVIDIYLDQRGKEQRKEQKKSQWDKFLDESKKVFF